MAYSSVLAAALSGASPAQLVRWRQDVPPHGPLLTPEVSADRPILYSFRDIIALRTCAYLRKDSSLQQIRTALTNLYGLGYTDHLSSYRLASDGDSIVLERPDESPLDLVKRPGQSWLADMADVLRPFTNKRGVDVPDLYRPRRHVEIDEGTRAGYPVIAGTRVPYDTVAGLVRDGVPTHKVEQYFPSVTADAAVDAISFADYVDQFTYDSATTLAEQAT